MLPAFMNSTLLPYQKDAAFLNQSAHANKLLWMMCNALWNGFFCSYPDTLSQLTPTHLPTTYLGNLLQHSPPPRPTLCALKQLFIHLFVYFLCISISTHTHTRTYIQYLYRYITLYYVILYCVI